MGLIPLGFALNTLRSPSHGLSFFGLPYPSNPTDRIALDALLLVYASRNAFVGVAIIVAALNGARKTLGVMWVAFAACAVVDGWVCVANQTGEEWGHWGYAPLLAVLGLALLR